jgi:hypothetical protein
VLEHHNSAGCVIGAECFAPGTADPSDSCQHCDPSAAPDAWTPVRDPDPPGVRCGVQRASIAAADVTCAHRTMLALGRRLQRASVIAARLTAARPPLARRLTARLVRLTNQMIHVIGGGCGSEDLSAALGTLRDQLRAMQALQG